MSDNRDDETQYGGTAYEAATSNATTDAGTHGAGARVAFCQDCGQPLTRETARSVPAGPNAGIFCAPCLTARTAAPYVAVPVAAAAYNAQSSRVSHPVLAGFLGMLPGVGAMYNGQYAKGFAHLLVFLVLTSFDKAIHGIFGLLIFGWFAYMVLDAYQTARAMRDGLPLPNPFHLNEIGERFGLGKNPAATWNTGGATPVAPEQSGDVPYSAPGTGAQTYHTPYPAAYQAAASSAPSTWTGYVPPLAAGSMPPRATSQGWGSVAGASFSAGYSQPPAPAEVSGLAPDYMLNRRQFPVAAVWLIGLGILVLAINLLPEFHVEGRWITPIVLAGVAALLFVRALTSRSGTTLVCLLRWPVVLLVLAILFVLQAADVASLDRTWPVLVIAAGILLLLERTLGARPSVVYAEPAPYGTSFIPEGQVPAAWGDSPATHTMHEPGTDITTGISKGGL